MACPTRGQPCNEERKRSRRIPSQPLEQSWGPEGVSCMHGQVTESQSAAGGEGGAAPASAAQQAQQAAALAAATAPLDAAAAAAASKPLEAPEPDQYTVRGPPCLPCCGSPPLHAERAGKSHRPQLRSSRSLFACAPRFHTRAGHPRQGAPLVQQHPLAARAA